MEMKEIEACLDEHVRPLLQTHGGDLEPLGFEDGIFRFKFTGHCAGCAAADLTAEDLVNKELTDRLPFVKKAVLVTEVSEELIQQARLLLQKRHA